MPHRGATLILNQQIHTILNLKPGPKSLEPTREHQAVTEAGVNATVTTEQLEQHRIDPRELEEYPATGVRGVPRRLKDFIAVPHRASGDALICTIVHSTHPSYPGGGHDIAVAREELLAAPALRARS